MQTFLRSEFEFMLRDHHLFLTEINEFLRFSSLYWLLRVTAWYQRWLRLRRSIAAESEHTFEDILTAIKLEDARLLWIRRVQAEYYKNELEAIQQSRDLSKSNTYSFESIFRFSRNPPSWWASQTRYRSV